MSSAPLRPIVLAEENPDDLFLLTRRIREIDRQHPVIGFRDAQGVIDYVDQALRLPERLGLPAVVMTDYLLPRIDGLTLIDWIRRQPRLATLRTAVITADQHPDLPARAEAAGASAFFRKFPTRAELATWMEGSVLAAAPALP